MLVTFMCVQQTMTVLATFGSVLLSVRPGNTKYLFLYK